MQLPETEARRPQAFELDRLDPQGLAAAFALADREAIDAVAAAGAELARAIELAQDALAAGGRLILAGAGTSGRLAVLEAAECVPTFRSHDVHGLLAGGPEAFLRAKEGVEDDPLAGRAALEALSPGPTDFVLGIAASGRTPWVLGLLEAAGEAGARRGLLCCSRPTGELRLDLLLVLRTGPELLTGSTRLKAGTATKCALNAITTGAMALRGKVLGDLMVDVIASNKKLEARAQRIVGAALELPAEAVPELLERAGGEVKTAILCGAADLDAVAARALLSQAGGHLRRALSSLAEPSAESSGSP